MNTASIHILRVGIAITFLWVGILILQNPAGWGGMTISWILNILPLPIKSVMIGTAFLDIFIGALLLLDVRTWMAALAGSLHLLVVLAAAGINAITVRDIGLLAGTLSLLINTLPLQYRFWEKKSIILK